MSLAVPVHRHSPTVDNVNLSGKRRKVRCRFTSDDASTCEWCLSRGLECVSQLQADGPTDQTDAAPPARLRRIETMLEELIAKSNHGAACCCKSHLAPGMMRQDEPGNDVLTDTSPLSHDASGGGILSLFNNSIVSIRLAGFGLNASRVVSPFNQNCHGNKTSLNTHPRLQVLFPAKTVVVHKVHHQQHPKRTGCQRIYYQWSRLMTL